MKPALMTARLKLASFGKKHALFHLPSPVPASGSETCAKRIAALSNAEATDAEKFLDAVVAWDSAPCARPGKTRRSGENNQLSSIRSMRRPAGMLFK